MRFERDRYKLASKLGTVLLTLVVAVSSLSSCSNNIYKQASPKNSDEALLESANILINDEEYDAALAKLDSVSTKGKTKRHFKITYASALAGQCGLNFINFFSRVADATSVTGLFSFLMAGLAGTEVQASSCKLALTQMRELAGADMIGDTGDEQIFMTILGMATIGAVLAEKADINASGVGDGTIDAGFDICSNADPEDVSDENVAHLLAALGTVILNIGGLAGGDSVSDSLDDLVATCDGIVAAGGSNPCAVTDPDQVSAGEIHIIRKLLDVEGFKDPSACDNTDAATTLITCCP